MGFLNIQYLIFVKDTFKYVKFCVNMENYQKIYGKFCGRKFCAFHP